MTQDPYVVDDITQEEELDIYRKAANAIYKIFGKERFLQFYALHDSDPHHEFSFIIAEKASELDPEAFDSSLFTVNKELVSSSK